MFLQRDAGPEYLPAPSGCGNQGGTVLFSSSSRSTHVGALQPTCPMPASVWVALCDTNRQPTHNQALRMGDAENSRINQTVSPTRCWPSCVCSWLGWLPLESLSGTAQPPCPHPRGGFGRTDRGPESSGGSPRVPSVHPGGEGPVWGGPRRGSLLLTPEMARGTELQAPWAPLSTRSLLNSEREARAQGPGLVPNCPTVGCRSVGGASAGGRVGLTQFWKVDWVRVREVKTRECESENLTCKGRVHATQGSPFSDASPATSSESQTPRRAGRGAPEPRSRPPLASGGPGPGQRQTDRVTGVPQLGSEMPPPVTSVTNCRASYSEKRTTYLLPSPSQIWPSVSTRVLTFSLRHPENWPQTRSPWLLPQNAVSPDRRQTRACTDGGAPRLGLSPALCALPGGIPTHGPARCRAAVRTQGPSPGKTSARPRSGGKGAATDVQQVSTVRVAQIQLLPCTGISRPQSEGRTFTKRITS